MRAVKADLATPLREGVERVAEEEGPRWAKRRVLARRGRVGEKGRAVSRTQPTLRVCVSRERERARKCDEVGGRDDLFAPGARALRRASLDGRSRDHPCHQPVCRMMRKWRER